MKTALFVFFLLLCCSHGYAATTHISFGQLAPKDTLQVRFTSEGCFHHHTYEFLFQRGGSRALTVWVTRLGPLWNPARQREEPGGRVAMGNLTLSGAEVAGLDRLLTFYRSSRPGGCTTRERIALTQRTAVNNTLRVKETYEDDSCGSHERADMTTFESLVVKVLQPASQRP